MPRISFRALIPAFASLGTNRIGKRKPGALLTIAASFLLFLASPGVSHADSGADNLSPVGGVFLSGNGFLCSSACAPHCTSNNCQAEFSATGTIFGSMIVPPPATNTTWGVDCAGTQCSGGARHDSGSSNILYGNYPTLCRFVDNTSSNSLFVPQATQTEFMDFINHAPAGIGFGYCTLGVNYSYTATASFRSGFYITANGGPANPPTPGASSPATLILPTTRVTNPISLSPSQPVTLPPYVRYDCPPGMSPPSPSCLARVIVETQNITVSMAANPNPACTNPAIGASMPNCNGNWTTANVASISCTVDGVYYAAGLPGCLDGYNPGSVTGVCGGLANPSCTPGSCVGSCTAGLLTGSFDNGTTTNWVCDGEFGGSGSGPCNSNDPGGLINGVCGSANGGQFKSAPSTNLCTAGTPTPVTGIGPWNWSCNGSGTGSNAFCSTGDPITGSWCCNLPLGLNGCGRPPGMPFVGGLGCTEEFDFCPFTCSAGMPDCD